MRLLRRARLDAAVRRRALATFEALGRAEAKVHGIALDRVHFHEVGAVDAVVDVTAAAVPCTAQTTGFGNSRSRRTSGL